MSKTMQQGEEGSTATRVIMWLGWEARLHRPCSHGASAGPPHTCSRPEKRERRLVQPLRRRKYFWACDATCVGDLRQARGVASVGCGGRVRDSVAGWWVGACGPIAVISASG